MCIYSWKGTGIEKSKRKTKQSVSQNGGLQKGSHYKYSLFFSKQRFFSSAARWFSFSDRLNYYSFTFFSDYVLDSEILGAANAKKIASPPSRLTPWQQSLPSQGQSGERSNLASRDMNFWSVAGRLLLPQAYSNPIGQPALMKTGRGPPQWRWLTVARISL